jgi:hypothetical protein
MDVTKNALRYVMPDLCFCIQVIVQLFFMTQIPFQIQFLVV